MNSKNSKQLLLNIIFGLSTILLCVFIFSQNNFELNKNILSSLKSFKEIASTILNGIIGKDNLLFRIVGATFALTFVIFIPIVSSILCIMAQLISFILNKKDKVWCGLFGKSISMISFKLSTITLNSLLFSLIGGFYCNRILITITFIINLVHVLLSIVFIRDKDENIFINLKGYKNKSKNSSNKKQINYINELKEKVKIKQGTQEELKNNNDMINDKIDKKISSIGNIVNEELVAPDSSANYVDMREYYCPECNEKLEELIIGGITMRCNKCSKTYRKDDYRFNKKDV